MADALHPGVPLMCVEYYGVMDPQELLAAVDVPAARYEEHGRRIGRLLCAIRKRNSVNAVIINGKGETIARMEVFR